MSILYSDGRTSNDSSRKNASEMPEYFHDLNLDQVFADVMDGYEFYELAEFFYRPLSDLKSILYRHEVFEDLHNESIFDVFCEFTIRMQRMRARIDRANKLHYARQRERWILDAIAGYCTTLEQLLDALKQLNLSSTTLMDFTSFLDSYVNGDYFESISSKSKSLKDQVTSIRYNLFITGNRITVENYEEQSDYGAEVEETFERFGYGSTKDYSVNFPNWPEMNPVEEKILEIVIRMYPSLFEEVQRFVSSNLNFADKTIVSVDRELQFYLSYLKYVSNLRDMDIKVSFPEFLGDVKEVEIRDGFDIALAQKLAGENKSVVCNDLVLKAKERIAVISGPNSGGKTTFARSVGQLVYLAKLGCPVPASSARIPLFDQVFTHFEREENLDDLRGKLEDELVRIHKILGEATPQSIIIMNESFGDTTLEDSKTLGCAVLRQIIELDAFCICVTFVDELSTIGDATLSMMSSVDPEDLTRRTFEIVVKPANGLAYAIAIAEKYDLTYERLKGRRPHEGTSTQSE